MMVYSANVNVFSQNPQIQGARSDITLGKCFKQGQEKMQWNATMRKGSKLNKRYATIIITSNISVVHHYSSMRP